MGASHPSRYRPQRPPSLKPGTKSKSIYLSIFLEYSEVIKWVRAVAEKAVGKAVGTLARTRASHPAAVELTTHQRESKL
jgi:hypothetical protein